MARAAKRKQGFLPIPIFITDPTFGDGGGLALVYLRDAATAAPGKASPPQDIYGIVAARTSNGSRLAGGGMELHFNQDLWQYRGFVGQGSVNLDYYASGQAGLPRRTIGYNLDGSLSFQQVLRRVGDKDLLLGLSWILADLNLSFDVEGDRPFFQAHELARRTSGLGLALEYDGRDNAYTPSSGWLGMIEAYAYAPTLGSDTTFQTYRAHTYAYWPWFAERLVLGTRVDIGMANGQVPFYRLPYVDLRGIPWGRYQDTRAATVEAELRWNFARRWAWIGFAGTGRTWGRRNSFADADDHFSKGTGLRFLLYPDMGLYVGVDYAWGPDDQAAYIKIGSAWH